MLGLRLMSIGERPLAGRWEAEAYPQEWRRRRESASTAVKVCVSFLFLDKKTGGGFRQSLYYFAIRVFASVTLLVLFVFAEDDHHDMLVQEFRHAIG